VRGRLGCERGWRSVGLVMTGFGRWKSCGGFRVDMKKGTGWWEVGDEKLALVWSVWRQGVGMLAEAG